MRDTLQQDGLSRNKGPEERLIRNAARLISTFHESELSIHSIIDRAMSLFAQFQSDNALNEYKALVETTDNALISSAEHAIEAMRLSPIMIYNPFMISGFAPNEDEFSDILADLFNPQVSHGFRKAMLQALLGAAADNTRGISTTADIAEIMLAIEQSDSSSIRVRRNYYHEFGKPDIVILGTNPSKPFIILIENKKLYGEETVTLKGVQTNRYYKILSDLAAKHNVAESSTIAIFLTPGGGGAKHRSFIPVSTHELSTRMISTIDAVTLRAVDRNCLKLVEAWLLTYDFLNGGIL
jgi:hypothetical protein